MDQSPPPDTNPIFPTGVVVEIMSRLPVKALLQCQLVCKDWQSLIHSNYFKHIHLDRRRNIYHWNNNPSNVNQQNNPGFSCWHGCNGLLLMKSSIEKKYCLWNPATRRVLELPDPHVDSIRFAISFCPTDKSYRVVSFYKDRNELGCQVLTLGGQADNNVWRQLDFPHPYSSKKRRYERVTVVASTGAVHCVIVTSVREDINIDVVSLDPETERFTVSDRLRKLLGQSSEWKNYWDMDWDGKLAIVDIVGENMELIEYKNVRWCEQKKVVHLPFLKKNGDKNKPIVIPLHAERGEIWFWLKGEKIFKFTIRTGKCTVVREAPTLFISIKNFPYRPSLVSFEGMVHDTKLDDVRSLFKSS